MIRRDKQLVIIRDRVDPDEMQATEVVLERMVLQQDAMLHIGTCTGYVMTLGKRSLLNFYDLDKLKADDVFVHRRPYGGSGTIYGPRDVLLGLYIPKSTFKDGYQTDGATAYLYFQTLIASSLRQHGLNVSIDESEAIRWEDGVCMHLQGRGEIVTPEGHKMVVSVFREDELGFYMRAILLVSTDWVKVYDYLILPTDPMYPVDSIELQLGRSSVTQHLIDTVIEYFSREFSSYQHALKGPPVTKAVEGIKEKYRMI